MICNECETVAHCTKHGCVPKQPAPVQEPVAWEQYGIKFAKGRKLTYGKPENLPSYIGVRALVYVDTPPAQPAPVQEPVRWSDYEPDGRRYPAVPDAMTSADIQEHIEYVAGWNDCRQAMLEMMK